MAKIEELKVGSVVLLLVDGEPSGIGIVSGIEGTDIDVMVDTDDGVQYFVITAEEAATDVVLMATNVFEVMSAMFDDNEDDDEDVVDVGGE